MEFLPWTFIERASNVCVAIYRATLIRTRYYPVQEPILSWLRTESFLSPGFLLIPRNVEHPA